MSSAAPYAERRARAALSRLAEPGTPKMTRLARQLGAEVLYDELLRERDPGGVRTDLALRLAACDPDRELEQADRLGVRFVVPGDEEWPGQVDDLDGAGELHERGGPPLGLWVRGPLRLDSLSTSLAVVGSRSATSYGAAVAAELAETVSGTGACIVSGGAFGIDQAAHRGSLAAGGRTLAVLACGADRIYPVAHRALLTHLAEAHAVVSEAPPGCAPTRIRFLSRNRLIAALTVGTVVVEAAVRSGALNTANWAGRMHRHVMGVPGPVTSAPSQGVHELIRTGAATLVASGHHVLEAISPAGCHLATEPRGRDRVRDRLSVADQQVLDAVPVAAGARVDSVARAAGMALLKVSTALDRLERAGLVELAADGWRLADAARD